MRLPGLGPKTARRIWQELGITTVADLKAAAEAQRAARARRHRAGHRGEDRRGARAAAARRKGRTARCSGRRCRSCARSCEVLQRAPGVGRGLARRLGAPHARDGARPRHHRDRDRPAGARRRLLLAPLGGRRRGQGLDRRRRSSRTTGCASTCASSRRRATATCCSTSPARSTTTSRCARTPCGAASRSPSTRSPRSRPARSTRFATEEEVYALPRLRLDPAGAARERRRARRRAQAASCRRSSSSATCAATCTRTRPGRTARTRSRTMVGRGDRAGLRVLRDLRPLAAAARRAARTSRREQIDALNELVAPFRILKGIEVNIRPDGTLDVVGRGARDARLGRRVGALALRARPDRARARRDGEPVRRLHRPSHEPQDRQAARRRTSTSSA